MLIIHPKNLSLKENALYIPLHSKQYLGILNSPIKVKTTIFFSLCKHEHSCAIWWGHHLGTEFWQKAKFPFSLTSGNSWKKLGAGLTSSALAYSLWEFFFPGWHCPMRTSNIPWRINVIKCQFSSVPGETCYVHGNLALKTMFQLTELRVME